MQRWRVPSWDVLKRLLGARHLWRAGGGEAAPHSPAARVPVKSRKPGGRRVSRRAVASGDDAHGEEFSKSLVCLSHRRVRHQGALQSAQGA